MMNKLKSYHNDTEQHIQYQRNNQLAIAYDFDNEVHAALRLISGEFSINTYTFKDFAPSCTIKPSHIDMMDLLTSIHNIRALNEDLIYKYSDDIFVKDNGLTHSKGCRHIQYDHDNLLSFFNVIIKDEAKKILGREYKLIQDGLQYIMVATDETFIERIKRKLF